MSSKLDDIDDPHAHPRSDERTRSTHRDQAMNKLQNTLDPQGNTHRRPSTLRTLLGLGAALAIAGCTITPKHLAPTEVKARVAQDTARMYLDQEPVSGPISMEEAVARSLKHNLDFRLKRMESALALGLTAQASMDTLPSLVASAGYRSRTNDSGGDNFGILDRVESNRPTSSEERRRTNLGGEFTWNVLDFGVSYYRARQQADQYLVAEERRRKVVQNILQDVRASYWRALGAQRLNAQADDVVQRAGEALARSREAEAQRIIAPNVALNYQRALLDATSMLNQRRQDLQFAKRELAAMMNLPPDTAFTLAEANEMALPQAPANLDKLEEMALLQRPELREEDLRRRITADEARRQILSLLPNLTFNLGARYDSNKYAYNQAWGEGSVSMAWNLLRWATLPAMQESQRAQVDTDDARRMALSMAVLTQTRLGAERYRMALEDFKLADDAAKVDTRLATYARATVTARLDSELEAVRTQARAVLGAYQRANAYANAHIAYGRLYNALGFDPMADDVQALTLPELTQTVRTHLDKMQSNNFAFASNLFQQPIHKVHLVIQGVGDPMLFERMTISVQELLARHNIQLDPNGTPLQMRLNTRADNGVEKATWTIRLMQPNGTTIGESAFHTTLPLRFRTSLYESSMSAALAARMAELKLWLAEIKS
jgi:outer membrane protein TolC